MARFADWLDLGRETITSLKTRDLANDYSLDWTETRRRLTTDHSSSIEQEPNRFMRWARTTSAILFGLTRRLAPHRRLFFLVAFVAFFATLFSIFTSIDDPPFWKFVQVVVMFLAMTLLLAMELIDKLKFRDELQLARDLQASLIPHEMPKDEQWEIAAFNWIANTVGGDIYDFVPLPDRRIAVLFGDASGHGMAAGLVMAVAHAAFRTQLEVDPSPPAIVGSLNRILCRTGGPRSFFASVYLLLSPDGSYVATVAGHPQVLHVGTDGRIAQRIGRGAYPLGVKATLTWEEVHGVLAPGERLILHSDGLTESRNAEGRELDDARVEAVANWYAASPATVLLDGIVSEWRSFMRGVAAEDDVSVAVIRRLAPTA